MRVVLINPPARSDADRHWAGVPPLGLAYLASALRAGGHEILLLDGKSGGLSAGEIFRLVAAFAPVLTGITAMTCEIPIAFKMAAAIRAGSTSLVAVGGAHANAVGAGILEECDAVDFVCIGEGEYLIRELADAIQGIGSYADIGGLAYRSAGSVRVNRPRENPETCDDLPFPAWDLFRPQRQLPILTHRGCPFRCVFCSHNSGFVPRYRSTENVLAEIEWLIDTFAPEIIRFEDETFGLDVARTGEILHQIINRGFDRHVRFSAQTRVDRINEAFVELLVKAGFETLEVGVESGCDAMLTAIKKGIRISEVSRAVEIAQRRGLRVWCKFILGHPGETGAMMRETARVISALNPDRVSVALMTPFPGTPIHQMALRGEGGYRMVSRDWSRFDKYSSGALELDTVSFGLMKLYQLWCYARLYVWNGRSIELLRLVSRHRALAVEMARSVAVELMRDLRASVRLGRHPARNQRN